MTGELVVAVLLLVVFPAAFAFGARSSGLYPTFVPQWDPAAEMRALALLHDVLSEEERRQLAGSGFLSVPSPSVAGRVYRVPARPGHVEVYEGGEHAMTVCVQPIGPLPSGDLVAMHKLLIEGNEKEYLQQARVHWSRV